MGGDQPVPLCCIGVAHREFAGRRPFAGEKAREQGGTHLAATYEQKFQCHMETLAAGRWQAGAGAPPSTEPGSAPISSAPRRLWPATVHALVAQGHRRREAL